MSALLDAVTLLCVLAGAVFFIAGTAGLVRFPDALTRLHALTKADNLGVGLIVFGLCLQMPSLLDAAKLVCVWLLTQFAGATVAQLIAHSRQEDERR